MYTYNLKQSNKQISQRCWSKNTEHWWWGHTGHSLSDGNMVVVTESTPQLAPYTPASPAFLLSLALSKHLPALDLYPIFSPYNTCPVHPSFGWLLSPVISQLNVTSSGRTPYTLELKSGASNSLCFTTRSIFFFSILIVVRIFVVIVKCLSGFLLCHYIKSMMLMIFSLFK